MENGWASVPVSLLLDPNWSAVMKVLWMGKRLKPAATPAELEAMTGLSRHTVLSGLSRLTACQLSHSGRRVKVPGDLLAERAIGAQAKVLYGLLQADAAVRGQEGQFDYASLCLDTGLARNTLKRAIADLRGGGWVQVTQASQRSPLCFKLGSPDLARSQVAVAAAAKRLKRAKFLGEALMQEYLSLLIESDQFTENARPGFLVNPQTGERLELDRFYPPSLAFEFHGAQHDRATARFAQPEVDAQHLRDLIKAGICLYRGVHLVIVRAEDLSLQSMTMRIGQGMPLRNMAGHEPLIDLLADASFRYRAAADAARDSGD